ncbi:hypothetical protein GGR57DRAFT_517703 [Xylariaceae sp. FL1272]|nr:hypothetical protein GGR57DRAFT_517703 [Xylariaceae sp. FL1272]
MPTNSEAEFQPGLVVIHVALFRMATASMAKAYRILGYKVHHGLDDPSSAPYDQFEIAAEATWPEVPNARPQKPFTRKDWDNLWGDHYDIATDLASPFVLELIKAYPDAKVVLVQREFEPWWESFQELILDTLFKPFPRFVLLAVWYILGNCAIFAMEKLFLGFFHVRSIADIDTQRARLVYDSYFERVRSVVPKENLLEYRLGDGWAPLCSFLGKEVPQDVAFPRVNDRAENQDGGFWRLVTAFSMIGRKVLPFFAGVTAIGTAVWYYGTRTSQHRN